MRIQPAKSEQNNLVADQPGLQLSLIGIAIAIVLGFSLRAVFSSDKIKDKISEAISNVGSEYKVGFSSAYLSLADGIFPDFSIIIQDIDFEFLKQCASRPQAHINQIRLPISLIALLQKKNFIDFIEADSVLLQLKEPWESCSKYKTAVAPSLEKDNYFSDINLNSQTRNPASGFPKAKPRSLLVRHLKISYLPLEKTVFELKNLNVDILSDSPRAFILSSDLVLNQELLATDYSSFAKINIDYDEDREKSIISELRGSWREGHYQVSSEFHGKSSKFKILMDIKDLPLSEIFPVLKKYKFMSSEFNGKQTWFTGKAQVLGNANEFGKSSVTLSDVKFEGDIGEIHLAQAEFRSIRPLLFRPLIFDLQKLKLDGFIHFLNRSHPSSTLGNLGVFSGNVIIKEDQDIEISGQHSGLEFIISNKGSRLAQKIDDAQINFDLKQRQWQGKIQDIKIQSGEFEGTVSVQADRDWEDVVIQSKAQKLVFSPDVEKLITTKGKIDKFSYDLNLQLKKSKLVALSGNMQATNLEIDKILFKFPKLVLHSKSEVYSAQLTTSVVELDPDSPAMKTFANMKQDWPLEVKDFAVLFQSRNLNTLSWQNAFARHDTKKIRSEGSWDLDSNLKGFVTIEDKSKKEKWEIQGSRDKPLFIKN